MHRLVILAEYLDSNKITRKKRGGRKLSPFSYPSKKQKGTCLYHSLSLSSLFVFIGGLWLTGCNSSHNDTNTFNPEINITSLTKLSMIGDYRSRTLFENPYANIPAQCYIETSYGTQNACLFCHSNAAARQQLGSTLAQAGLDPFIGNLQLEYAFGAANNFTKSPNINPWENTIFPQKLNAALEKKGIDPAEWDMKTYIKEDNWQEAYSRKMGSKKESDSQIAEDEFRLFPALNPENLPAQSDGFVRTTHQKEALFQDNQGLNTGWRSINFMPYGIFAPHTGSVSGVYIRLDTAFMKDENGFFDLEIYKANLALLEKAIQDRIESSDTHYLGGASDIKIERGLFPLKTEFAHPLHYVDVDADGRNINSSKFAGLRANRVKEVRYMIKYKMHYPTEAVLKDEDAPLYYNQKESWIDNGAGWWMSAFIEDEKGRLRGQKPEELMQCVGCHSSVYGFEPERFTSGTGNTIDTVWSFSRKFADDLGWGEMDYLGYKRDLQAEDNETSGDAHRGDPINRDAKIGEYHKFLNHVVGASLYGDMPESMENYLQNSIKKTNGYSKDMPKLEFVTAGKLKNIQRIRLDLMREFTGKKAYLTDEGYIQAPLLYPTLAESLKGATGYRKVVATQRYTKGKDYFGEVPFTFKYYRDTNESYTHIDDTTPYQFGEIITDRPFHKEETILKNVGKTTTLIDENGDNYDPEYLPVFLYPQQFETK